MKQPTRASARGAILIVVAISIFVLTILAAFVVDMGALFLSRVQAQNAADAGALAGATSLAFDGSDVSTSGKAYQSAMATAGEINPMYGGAHGVHVDIDPTTTWDHPAPLGCATGGCVQVDVYADGTHGGLHVPAYFARIFGVSTQSIKATATAQVYAGNAIQCMKPFIVPDRYFGPDWPAGVYDAGTDTYRPPTTPGTPYYPYGGPGPTGYGKADIGTSITLKTDTTTPSFYMDLSLDCDESVPGHTCSNNPGDPGVETNISGCTNHVYKVGDDVVTKPGNGINANKLDPRIDAIIAQDPGASVQLGTGPDGNPTATVIGTCAPRCSCGTACANGLNGLISPRIIAVALGDPNDVRPGRTMPITIVNIFSFFVLQTTTDTLNGILVSTTAPAVASAGGGINPASGFILIPTLVR